MDDDEQDVTYNYSRLLGTSNFTQSTGLVEERNAVRHICVDYFIVFLKYSRTCVQPNIELTKYLGDVKQNETK